MRRYGRASTLRTRIGEGWQGSLAGQSPPFAIVLLAFGALIGSAPFPAQSELKRSRPLDR